MDKYIILNEDGERVAKGTLQEMQEFKEKSLNIKYMSKTKVRKWIITPNTVK